MSIPAEVERSPSFDLASAMRRAIDWHRARFPNASAIEVALKLCSEAGELGDAVNGLHGGAADRYVWNDVKDEAADVIIVLLILLGRYVGCDEEEIALAVEAKLTKLTTPGAHRVSMEVP